MSTKILRNMFITVGVPVALAPLLVAGTNDGLLNFSNTPFLRPQPTIITFDAPGASTGGPFQGTLVAGINPAGVIAGGFFDANEVEHTYLRFPDGTFTTFDAPGAGTGPGQGTFPLSINPQGAIAGWYVDASNVNHSFVRAANGTITAFDAPGAGTGPGQGTLSFSGSINPAGAIAGAYFDSSNVFTASYGPRKPTAAYSTALGRSSSRVTAQLESSKAAPHVVANAE